MTETIRIGLDLAKRVFQVHGVDAGERVTVQRSLRREPLLDWFRKQPPCLIGMEACATAHYWQRELSALGHSVRMIPPAYVKAYVRRNKNDAADAAAICEAVSRPTMRFVPPKTEAQQAASGAHKTREQLIKQQTATQNHIRGQMAEFGLIAPQGRLGMQTLLAVLEDAEDSRIPALTRTVLQAMVAMLRTLQAELAKIDAALLAWTRESATARHLMTIPGIGPITASALAARVPDPSVFDNGRQFSASLGQVPRQDGTGGKVKLGPISKRGDGYLRRLLVNGATTVLNGKRARQDPWLVKLLAAKARKVAAVALANKMARIAWAIMMRQEDYRSAPVGVTP
jgi:transposase